MVEMVESLRLEWLVRREGVDWWYTSGVDVEFGIHCNLTSLETPCAVRIPCEEI